MPRGRKKKRAGDEGGNPGKGSFANRPFAGVELPSVDAPEEPVSRVDDSPDEVIADAEIPVQPSDDDLLSEMMEGVEPLLGNKQLASQKDTVRPMKAEADDSALVMRKLDEMVHGNAPFDLDDTNEYIEASLRGFDRRILKKLRRGEFSIQDHIDLHGMRREEARPAIAAIITGRPVARIPWATRKGSRPDPAISPTGGGFPGIRRPPAHLYRRGAFA